MRSKFLFLSIGIYLFVFNVNAQQNKDSVCNCNALIISETLGAAIPTSNSLLSTGVQGAIYVEYASKIGSFGIGYGFNILFKSQTPTSSSAVAGTNSLQLGYSISFLKKGILGFFVNYTEAKELGTYTDLENAGISYEINASYPILVVKKYRILDLMAGYQLINIGDLDYSNFRIGLRHYGIAKTWKRKEKPVKKWL